VDLREGGPRERRKTMFKQEEKLQTTGPILAIVVGVGLVFGGVYTAFVYPAGSEAASLAILLGGIIGGIGIVTYTVAENANKKAGF